MSRQLKEDNLLSNYAAQDAKMTLGTDPITISSQSTSAKLYCTNRIGLIGHGACLSLSDRPNPVFLFNQTSLFNNNKLNYVMYWDPDIST